MTDFRALCAELVDDLELCDWPYKLKETIRADIDRARAALADGPAVPDGREPASVAGQPSDEEIMGLMPQQMHEDLAYAARAMANEAGTDNRKAKGFMRIALNRHAVDLARAVLARWGTSNLAETRSSLGGMPTPVPADKGEVEELVVDELVKRLRTKAATEKANRCHYSAILLTRAANLLEQRHPTPVPVSERLPGPEDCDAEGRCWWWRTDDADEWWELLCISDAREYNAGCGNARYTHWLPAHALPLPGQEVEG